jgi:hypothetical protein
MASKRPRNLSSYLDVKAILDECNARQEWPVRYVLEKPSQAATWRHRAHRYRSVLRHMNAESRGVDPQLGTTEYDMIQFRLDGPVVVIDHVNLRGKLMFGDEQVRLTITDPSLTGHEDFGYNIDLEDDDE